MTKSNNPDRREALKKILTGGAALATGGAFVSYERDVLAAQLTQEEAASQERRTSVPSSDYKAHTDWGRLASLKKPMEKATLKGLDISKMFMGGNLIGGWAHARDKLYVDNLVVAYHTREKIMATFKLAEACGINAHLGHFAQIDAMVDYWENAGGKMHFIADSHSLDNALHCLDKGASAAYLQGGAADRLAREGNVDEIATFVNRLRERDACVGIGAHRLETVKACVEKGIEPDFWMKTIHHGDYWSHMPDKPEHDNVWCWEPEAVAEFMNSLQQPWIGFKVLAAGAILPRDGFRFAFESGADFLCVGMFDFQIVDNVNTCMEILGSEIERKRPWRYS